MQKQTESGIYEFEEFRLDARSHRLLRRDGEIVPLTPKAVELLIYLVENPGRVLSKDELIERVWENSFVEEANLSQTIFVLRKALGENTKRPRFILTAPGHGYQFIAPVREFVPEDQILDESILSDPPSFEPQKPKTNSRETNIGRLLAFAVPLVLLIALGIYWFYPKSKTAGLSEIKTIAVLPFEDLSAEHSEKYLGLSLADALGNRFSEIKEITVRPTRSVLKYSESREDLGKIGRELQVDAVLDGRIQHSGERIRISVQLVRTSDNVTIWTGNFDDQFTNFFAVQDSISKKVVQSLALQMNDKELERFNKRETANAEAYQDYLRGRYFWNRRTGENLLKAITYFEKATQKDPNFALAYAGLADCYVILPEYAVMVPHEAFPKAKIAIGKALALDDQLAETYAALGYTQAFYDWDWVGAERSFKRSFDLNPNYATSHQWYGEVIIVLGRFDESLEHIERAAKIDPVSPIMFSSMAGLYDFKGDVENQINHAKKALEIDPNFAYGYFYLSMGLERKGMDAEAAESFAKTMELFGEPPECATEVREAFKKGGLKGFWKKRLEQMETRPHLQYLQPYYKALVQIRLGDREGTLQSLNKSFERRDHLIVFCRTDPRLAPLRDDPRFQDLVARIGL